MTRPDKPRLVLIDGHSIIHRSFHAMKQLAEPLKIRATGELIGAPFGFANTFLAVFGEVKPTHVIVTLDKGAITFRHEITETYKATRVAMPDEEREEFSRQMARSREVIETFGMPIYEREGYEADDLMGTLSRQAAGASMPKGEGSEEGRTPFAPTGEPSIPQGEPSIPQRDPSIPQGERAEVYLVSMDSDIAQLVTDDVHLWMYRPYQRDSVLYMNAADVKERYGVLPEQVPDIKALRGDVSDNIPGIPGVGDKTAAKLVEQFGSVEAMLERVDEVQPAKMQALIRDHADQLRQSKRLATIVCDAPVELDMEAADFYAHYDRTRVTELFRELEFRTLIPRLPEGDPSTGSGRAALTMGDVEERYSTVRGEDELRALVERIAKQKTFILDIQATERDAMRADIVGFSIALGPGDACYIPTGHAARLDGGAQLPLPDVLASLAPLIQDPEVKITGHNLKFDVVVLENYGVHAHGVEFDTMIAAFLTGEGGGSGRPEEGSLSLKWLVARKLGTDIDEAWDLLPKATKKSQLTIPELEVESMSACAARCADMTARLRAVLEPELEQKEMRRLFDEIEMPLVCVLARMELNGVAVDTGALREMSESLTMEIRRLEEEIYKSVGHEFNIGSPKQLSDILFDELHLPKTRRLKTGGYATDKDSLEAMRGVHEMIDLLFEYRELTKLKSTYLDPLPSLVHPRTKRVHTDFNQTGAATGRLSSSNPNLMNIPVRTALGEQIRRAFIARDAQPDPQLLAADYSQIELRIIAHITGDPALVEAFQKDEDIHAATASQVFNVPIAEVTAEMRRRAKVFNFGVLYGLSEYGLSVRERISREEAGEFIRRYFEKYPGIQEYTRETVQKARELGYVETLFGRRRYIPEIHSGNFNVRNAAERAAINMPVQGTAADIIKIAMNRLDDEMQRREMRSLMTLQVHDELIFECPGDELEEIRRLCLDIMPKSLEMRVPVKVDTKVGKNWGEMKYGEPVEVGEF